MGQQWDVIAKAADTVAGRLGRAPVGAVLGSGLSECVDNLERPQVLQYRDIPGMAMPTKEGHRGALIYGTQGGVPVLALCGRIHMYEGRPTTEVAMGVRLLSMLGVHTLLVTSAVESVDPSLLPGQIMLVEDHLKMSGASVLKGDHDDRFGPRFPDMFGAYDPALRDTIDEVGKLAGVSLEKGILAHVQGPERETPAEVRLTVSAGARASSMSMVPDVVVARQRGMRVAGLACVTSMGAGIGDSVTRTARARGQSLASSALHSSNMQALLSGALPRLAHLPERRPTGA